MSNPRIVFYTCTRNFYHIMALSLKSLLAHTRIDTAYLLIEDDTFPEPLPDCARIVNVSNQQYFRKDGPNYRTKYSHIILMRVALPLMFPDIDTALSIDADTLVLDDISQLFSVDMSRIFIAATEELWHLHHKRYFNYGVVIMNFSALRSSGIAQRAIDLLNSEYYHYPEQDVMNELCDGNIGRLPTVFNYCKNVTAKNNSDPVIRHYIGFDKSRFLQDAKPYENLSWDQIERSRK